MPERFLKDLRQMKYSARERWALALLVTAGIFSQPLLAVTPTWFDINPSQSNGDRNSGSSGRVNHVGAASDLSRVYAATEWGGLYTSFDMGNSWVRINTFSPSATWDVKVDPSNNMKVYATSFYDGRLRQRQSGISISNNAGNTWTTVDIPTLDTLNCQLFNAQNEPSGWQIAINPTNSQTVFVGTNCGLARTLDGGGTWTFIEPTPNAKVAEQVFAVIAQGAATVDVISSNGHFRSTDNGGSWSPVPSPPGPVSTNSGVGVGLAASPAESYVLFAENTTDIWESDNGGTTFTSLVLPLKGSQSNVQGRIPFVKTNQLSTSNQFDVWYGDINVFKTTATNPSTLAPGGNLRAPKNSWTSTQDSAHDDTGDIMFDPRARAGACPQLFTGDGGIFDNTQVNNPSCQGPSWQQPNVTPHATWIWGFDGVGLSPGIHGITYGLQDDGGFAATNVAEGFSPPPPNWNNFVCCDLSSDATQPGNIVDVDGSYPGRAFELFIRGQNGSGGGQISNYPSGALFNGFTSGRQVAESGQTFAINLSGCPSTLVPCPVGEGVYFGNGGSSWTSLNAPTAPTSSGGSIKIAKLGGQPNIFYNTSSGSPETPGVLFVSTLVATTGAPGSNWTPIPLPDGISTVTVYDADPNDGRRIIISGIENETNNFQIWMTVDLGAHWTHLTKLENEMLRTNADGVSVFENHTTQGPTEFEGFGTYWQPSMIQFDPLNSTTIVAGAMDSGVFLSLDDGANWQIINDPTNPTSASPPIPRPLYAHFSPGRFNANTAAFDVWVGARGAGVRKVVIDQTP
jgi:hypothetical protein